MDTHFLAGQDYLWDDNWVSNLSCFPAQLFQTGAAKLEIKTWVSSIFCVERIGNRSEVREWE